MSRPLCSFRRISSINLESFKLDLEASSLLTNPLTDHNDLLSAYNSTLLDLLNKHAPVINNNKGPSIKYVTLFLGIFAPHPLSRFFTHPGTPRKYVTHPGPPPRFLV